MNTDRTARRTLAIAVLLGAALAGAQTTPAPAAPAAAAPAAQPVPAARRTLAQIRQAFDLADTNSDGQLTRAEAQRLAIMPPFSFEEMDVNKNGFVDRGEYEGAFTRQAGS